MATNELERVLERLHEIETGLKELLAVFRSASARKAGLPEQEWFSIEEVAVMTGLSADHVRRHVTSGMLPVCNQGTFEKPYYRIRRADVDAWMSQRMMEPEPAPRKRRTMSGGYPSRHHGKARTDGA